MRILVTGAAGVVAGLTLARLLERYDVCLTDRRQPEQQWPAAFHLADLTDLPALCSLCRNIDVILHLGAEGQLSTWPQLWPSNLVGFHNVLLAARAAGCQRVIFASTIQVVAGYPAGMTVPAAAPPRPLNPYSLTKAIGETMAHQFALQGSLSVLCIRLGAVLPRTSTALYHGAADLDSVITADDLARLWIAAIEAGTDLRFGIFHGLSANRQQRLDLTETMKLLDYVPVDDAYELARQNGRRLTRRGKRMLGRMARRLQLSCPVLWNQAQHG